MDRAMHVHELTALTAVLIAYRCRRPERYEFKQR